MTLELVYETHATTTDNELGIATGWLPGELSAAGRQQAVELGLRRRNDRISAVYVSDLNRATQTAEIALADTALPIMTDPRLRECNYGSFNGMPVARLERLRSEHVDEPWPDGESYREVVARTAMLLAELLRDHDGKRVLLVGHSANQFAVEHLVRNRDLASLVASGLTWQPGWEYRVGHEEIVRVAGRGRPIAC